MERKSKWKERVNENNKCVCRENQKEKSEIVFSSVVIRHMSSIEQIQIRPLVEVRIKRIWNLEENNRKVGVKKKNIEKLERKITLNHSLIEGETKEKLKASKKINRKAVKNNREKLERKKNSLTYLQSGATCKKKSDKKNSLVVSYRKKKKRHERERIKNIKYQYFYSTHTLSSLKENKNIRKKHEFTKHK